VEYSGKGNELSGSVKDEVFLGYQNDSQLIQLEALNQRNKNTKIYIIYVTKPC
jgi:hypothetical protein